MQTPCQVEVIPRKSEGIEPFHLVNSPPGQVKDASSRPINSLSVQSKMRLRTRSTFRCVKLGSILANQKVSSPLTWSTLRQVKSKMRLRTRSTLHRVQSKMRLRTRSTFCRVKSGSILANQKVSSPSTWSTLRQVKSKMRMCLRTRSTLRRVKSGPCPRTRSTLRWALLGSRPQCHVQSQPLYPIV